MEFAIPVNHRVKLKESEKRDKYLDLAREGSVQGLEDFEIRGILETIQITALLRSAKILRRVLET